ncbi:MAG: MATE family efflux transporter [Eubacteriales bacterium]|nr:MATE family efflux transporter [Eubacteriales bacterium]
MSKTNKYEIDMCNGSIMDKLISFSIPLMLSSILQLLFNAVDIVVVGRFSGSQALAAVGSTSALISMFINLFIGVSLGANVLAARFYASGRAKEMSETVHTAITFALISGVVMSFVGIFFAKGALGLMDTPKDVIDQSVLYMRIYFIGMPFFMLYNYGAAVLRAVGDTKRPLFFLIIAGVTNAGLNMFLVIVFHMGVAGVAIATVISQLISCVLVLRCLYKTESTYQLRFSKLTLKWRYLKQIFLVGIPAGIQSTVINFSNVLLQSSVNSFGSIAMAGYTAANNIFGFLYAAVNSVTQACMSFTSQNFGVGKWKRMDKVLINCIILSVSVAVILGGGAYIFGPNLLKVYTSDPEVIQCGMEVLLYTTVTYFMCGLMDLFPGALRGMGHSAVPMILSVIGTVGTRIVWIFLVFPAHRSLDILFISYPASWIITIILQVICFLSVRKKLHRKMGVTA